MVTVRWPPVGRDPMTIARFAILALLSIVLYAVRIRIILPGGIIPVAHQPEDKCILKPSDTKMSFPWFEGTQIYPRYSR